MPPVSITFSGDTLADALAAAAVAVGTSGVERVVASGAAAAPAKAADAAPKARSRARPATEAPPDNAASATAPASTAAAASVDKKAVIEKLVKLINANDAVGRNGKQIVTDLCLSFGGKNASAIDPAKYPAVIAAADKALASLNEDPAA